MVLVSLTTSGPSSEVNYRAYTCEADQHVSMACFPTCPIPGSQQHPSALGQPRSFAAAGCDCMREVLQIILVNDSAKLNLPVEVGIRVLEVIK